MNAVLVFNCHYNGLAVIRELARNGVREIYALDSYRSVGTFSKYAKFIKCPDPLTEENCFIQFLMEFAKNKTCKPVLFPTNDHWVQAIARHKRELEKYYLTWSSEMDVIDLIINKDQFYSWAQTNQIPVPITWNIITNHCIDSKYYPIIAKPSFKAKASNDNNEKKQLEYRNNNRLVVLSSLAEVRGYLNKVKGECVLQEYVKGLSDSMYTVGIYANKYFEVKGLFTGHKLRGFPVDIGDCMFGQVERVPEKLIELVKTVVKRIKYTGIAEFEFKKDCISGEFKLIEINPRSWSWIGITPSCGVELAWMAYCDLTGLREIKYTCSNVPDGSVKFVRYFEDKINCLRNNKKSGFKEWHMTKKEWRASLQCDKLVFAEYTKDDIKPAIYTLVVSWVKNNTILDKLWRYLLKCRFFES